jgi:hypothetical protein
MKLDGPATFRGLPMRLQIFDALTQPLQKKAHEKAFF